MLGFQGSVYLFSENSSICCIMENIKIYYPEYNYFCFLMHTESASVSSYAALQSSSLTTQRFQALSSINSALLSTNPSFADTNHSRGQSLDLGRENTASSSARNSDIDHALSRVSSCKSFISDTESWMYDQNSSKDVQLATTLPSPNRQVIEIPFFWFDEMILIPLF